jgi:hypothetical protein
MRWQNTAFSTGEKTGALELRESGGAGCYRWRGLASLADFDLITFRHRIFCYFWPYQTVAVMLKSAIVRLFARFIARDIARWSAEPVAAQERQFRQLLSKGSRTAFGREHGLRPDMTVEQFQAAVPIRDYEAMRTYIDRIVEGENDVLWPGRPLYFAKTSGTTSGVKYIPISQDSIPNHLHTARNALFNRVAQWNDARFLVGGKVIFLSGSPVLDQVGGIPTGRLSGIVNHHVPAWLRGNQLPSYDTNCLEDWETKLERIVQETRGEDMRLISGIPPWVQMYYERLLEETGKKTVQEALPNLSLFVYGGVNFEPYRANLEKLVGQRLPSLETFPASEGFIAFQDTVEHQGLLLNVDSGIFFEFVPADRLHEPHPPRLSLGEVELGVNYALIIHNNAGLWGYNIGDTVEFVSLSPYRLRVTGRVKHFISAFGEHVIGKEVEQAMLLACEQTGARLVEFTVAPQVNPPSGGQPYHEWLVEFDAPPVDMRRFAELLDRSMQEQNIYYRDLIAGHILRPLVVTPLRRDAFRLLMKEKGKLGGQNKVPRLSDHRELADGLLRWSLGHG